MVAHLGRHGPRVNAMTGGARALFVFAHQDDEVAAASRISFEIQRGTDVFCAFLTDGGAPRVRNAESIAALGSLGVAPDHILVPGSEIPIADGTLPGHLNAALDHLERATAGIQVHTVYCLAWEGGHQDHDASHLVAAAFARRRRILDRCFEIPLYRGAYGPFFRVFSPVDREDGWMMRHLTLREGLSIPVLALHYKSQRRSWLGLFPEVFLKAAILRREVVRRVDPERLRRPPHAGTLFYERRFHVPAAQFAEEVRPFIERYLSQSFDQDSGADRT